MNHPLHLIYLHGFNSSPASTKAQLTAEFFAASTADVTVHVPALPPEPAQAMRDVETLICKLKPASIGLIGSSLGGYYSLYLHARYNLPCALINPAIRPYELLQDYLGINTNLYTGARYEVRQEHMLELQGLDTVDINPNQVLLLTQTGDEVLDYQQALDKLPGAAAWIRPFGDHAFEDYRGVLPAIAAFMRKNLQRAD